MADPAHGAALDTFLGRPKPTFWSRYRRWIIAGVGVLVFVLLVSRCLPHKAPPAYQAALVARGDLRVLVTAVGNLAPTNQITVGSQISGLVSQVLVEVNDHVKPGQPVALIDTRRLDDSVNGSSAALNAQLAIVEQQKATVKEAEAQLERYRQVNRLSQGRVPSKTEMATAEATALRAVGGLRAAEAQVAVARATLSSDRTNREYAVIRSPVAGVVLSRQVDPGQTVAAAFSTPVLFTIAEDLSRMKLDVAIDEADVGQVREGQTATFTVDAFPGRAFPAVIKRVNLGSTGASSSGSSSTSGAAASTSGSVVSYTAELTVRNEDLTLRPGMTATASIAVEAVKDALLVPNGALRFTPPEGAQGKTKTGPKLVMGGPPGSSDTTKQERSIGRGSRQVVYVLGDNGALTPISVVTGSSDGRLTAVVSSDLKPGMKVVTGLKAPAP
jgi:HlyD family secretion protein